MFLRHKPAGASKDTLYEFRPGRTDFKRAQIAERLYSKACGERRTWEQFVAEAKQGSIAARKVALWLAITDKHPMTRYDDVPDFTPDELVMEYSKHELREMREAIEGSSEILEVEKRAMLAGLDDQILQAEAGSDEPDPEPDPEVEAPQGKGESEPDPSTS